MDITKIKPYEKNAKTHPPEQIRLIAASLRDFGWQSPIKLGKDLTIIAGHGRFQAWQEYGADFKLKEPWVIDESGQTISGEPEQRKLTIFEERDYRIRDNKIAESDWDRTLLVPELQELKDEGADILDMGFTDDDLILTPDGLGDYFKLAEGDRSPFQNMTFTFADEQAERIKEAMRLAPEDEYDHFGNENSNGNKLFSIVEQWLQNKLS